MTEWIVEEIPDGDQLYYRIPAAQVGKQGSPQPGHFRENKGSISTDWSKYSTPGETRARQGIERAASFGVIALLVGGVRSIEGLAVVHEPDSVHMNRAHTGIYGMEQPGAAVDLARRERIRTALYKLVSGWEIPPSAPVSTVVPSSKS